MLFKALLMRRQRGKMRPPGLGRRNFRRGGPRRMARPRRRESFWGPGPAAPGGFGPPGETPPDDIGAYPELGGPPAGGFEPTPFAPANPGFNERPGPFTPEGPVLGFDNPGPGPGGPQFGPGPAFGPRPPAGTRFGLGGLGGGFGPGGWREPFDDHERRPLF